MSTHTYSHVYNQAHSFVFLSDNMRNVLREVIWENKISPEKLMQDWKTIERGIRTWLDSGHLNKIVIEFFKPGSLELDARWDFPIRHSGSGVVDDMWLDKNYLRQVIAKSKRPSSDCTYRILLCTDDGAPEVSGFTSCSFLSTGQMTARQAGTVIATGHVTASATYWR
jgi:hypothetical protein